MKLRILNETGHTELAVSKSDIMDHIQEHATHWVFLDGEMVSRFAHEALSKVLI